MGIANDLDRVARANGAYVEALYRQYLADPASVDEKWALFFAGFELAGKGGGAPGRGSDDANGNGGGHGVALAGQASWAATTPAGVFSMVMIFRQLGHYIARLDPLGGNLESHPLIDEVLTRLSPEEMDLVVEGAGGLHGIDRAPIREVLARCRAIYCGTIAVQYSQIADKAERDWIQGAIEPTLNRPSLSREDRVEILRQLVAAEEFEQFLHHRFVGAKRFSIEGADAVIPLLDAVVEDAAESGVRELIMGMAHRGRLNVLAHTLRKPVETIMSEFEGKLHPGDQIGEGDVKYHMGYSHDHVTRRGKPIHLSLSPNPSHLEHVNPVIEGIVRAKQDRRGDVERGEVVPLLIHGDAAFTGQGIVAETLSLSELKAYRTGGTVHVIIDNRVGFTASPDEYRFTPYASDIARLIQAPVFHVNGDDPEAAVQAARLAIAYRQRFKKDVIIDVICYRRHGHNETDDPTFTQPLMYRKIAAHPTTRRIYEKRLLDDAVISPETAEAVAREARERLETALAAAKGDSPTKPAMHSLGGTWQGLERAGKDWSAETRVPRAVLERIARGVCEAPEGFQVHPKVKRLYEQRLRSVVDAGGKIDWGTAEMLAFGSLLLEGTGVRLAGQDAGRGTFTHRHAVWTDVETGVEHVPLASLDPKQAPFTAIDSMLSEEGIFGFELGFSWADPWTLGLWEAQFGDFANVAQAMIDVFLVAAESKWQRMSGIVLLLPHGYEGQGPEHSSARLERFLQLCGKDNIQVVNLTTPAQYFHALRRQMRRKFRKPLVVMSPKSLLRHPEAVSTTDELAEGRFETVLDETRPIERAKVRRVVLTCGRLYYALAAAREKRKAGDVAIVRVEQLYPFPGDAILSILGRYPAAASLVWAQDEPWNMGAWHFVHTRLAPLLKGRALEYVGREEAASPATGSSKTHEKEEKAIVERAFA
jgi:2-oxoglutarate dehydrogenase E1 component